MSPKTTTFAGAPTDTAPMPPPCCFSCRHSSNRILGMLPRSPTVLMLASRQYLVNSRRPSAHNSH
jgi:hypothetical protein